MLKGVVVKFTSPEAVEAFARGYEESHGDSAENTREFIAASGGTWWTEGMETSEIAFNVLAEKMPRNGFNASYTYQESLYAKAPVVFPPAYASYVKAPIHPAAGGTGHRATSKHKTKVPTYAAARGELFAYLRQDGWKLDTSLKIPHATSPDNRTRVWFKAQAVYVDRNNGGYGVGRFDFKSARSSWLDIRALSPAQFAKDVQT